MNLVLFESAEIDRPLSRADRRAAHLVDVLRRQVGDTFDAAVVNGPRGKATLRAITEQEIEFTFVPTTATSPAAAARRVTLVVGLPRPQTARDILRDATTLGVAAIQFVRTEKSEPNYAQSTLWTSGEWRRQLIAGAEQAFDPHLPDTSHHASLLEALAALPATASARLALDNYEGTSALGDHDLPAEAHVVVAIGAERGWSERERAALRAHGFTLVHLGARVLRTETACVAALAIVQAKLRLM